MLQKQIKVLTARKSGVQKDFMKLIILMMKQ